MTLQIAKDLMASHTWNNSSSVKTKNVGYIQDLPHPPDVITGLPPIREYAKNFIPLLHFSFEGRFSQTTE